MKKELITQILLDGDTVQFVYDDKLNLQYLGKTTIHRASYVEPDKNGNWWADMKLSGGPKLGPFKSRKEALRKEIKWLHSHIL